MWVARAAHHGPRQYANARSCSTKTHSREAHGRTSMKKARKRKKQQGCKITEMIDAIEKTASMAVKIYNEVEPIIRAILTNGRKPK